MAVGAIVAGLSLTLTAPAATAATRPADSAGAPTSSSFPVPAGAVYVATNGNDGSAGSQAAPVRSLGAAVAKAPAGGTVVVRGGSYNEGGVTIPAGKRLTVQNMPGETVWFDGAGRQTGFTASGSTWVKSNYSVFDNSPTYTKGAPDGTSANWRFVSPAAPMAAHPDQVWVNGTEQNQVGSRAAVTAGTFFVDRAARQLVLGSNPNGANVEASTKSQALRVLSDDVTIRGLGFRRYANSVPERGVITAYAHRTTVQNVSVLDAATGGLALFGTGSKVVQSTIRGAGQLGIQADHADNLLIDRTRVQTSNDQRFNPTPAAGGIKTTSTRGLTVRGSVIENSTGAGVWADESTYNMTIVGNDIRNNTRRGIFLELSSLGTVADNRVVGNGDFQISIRNTDRIKVWNNTVIGTTTPIEFTQDTRTPANAAYARNERRPYPDPEMSFLTARNEVGNNVVQAVGGTNRLINVEDYTKARSGAQLVSSVNGSVYSKPAGSPSWLLVWSRPGTDPFVLTSVPDIRAKTGQESTGTLVQGGSAVDGSQRLVGSVAGQTGAVARPLRSDVAATVGRPAGLKQLGAWL